MQSESAESVALVIRYFPAEQRLSGLASFGRELAIELESRCRTSVYSGERDLGWFSGRKLKHYQVPPPFWGRVWRNIYRDKPTHLIILSGIHSPRWALPQAFCIASAPIPKYQRLFVQAVGLDAPWMRMEALAINSVARVAMLNPNDSKMVKAYLPDIIEMTPGVSAKVKQSTRQKVSGRPLRIGFLGHFNEVKGADRLPLIFDAIPAGTFQPVVAGVGHLGEQLKQWAGESRHNVELYGFLERPIDLLAGLDVLVAPFRQSATVLGLSQVVLEAIAHGVPVVGTPVDAIQGVIRHGIEGVIAESNEDIAAALIALAANPERVSAMSIAATERSKLYTISHVADSMLRAIGLNEHCIYCKGNI